MLIMSASLSVINHLLDQSAWARKKLAPFVGRTVRIQFAPWQLDWQVTPDGRFAAVSAVDAAAVTLHLPANTPFLLAAGKEALLAAARIEGVADFAETLSFVAKHLDWDVEEDLARLIGDIAAHRLIAAGSALFAWQKQAAGNLLSSVAEYCAHERRHLRPPPALTRAEFARHTTQLAQFNQRLGRLEQAGKIT